MRQKQRKLLSLLLSVAMLLSILPTMGVSVIADDPLPDSVTREWRAFPEADRSPQISQPTANGHVLTIDTEFDESDFATLTTMTSATLTINASSDLNYGSTRHIHVWTDLTGPGTEEFAAGGGATANADNYIAKRTVSGTKLNIDIPARYLFNGIKTATKIYIVYLSNSGFENRGGGPAGQQNFKGRFTTLEMTVEGGGALIVHEVCGNNPCTCTYCDECGELETECICCPVCQKYPCECICPECGNTLPNCSCCPDCSKAECICTVIAEWDFADESYADFAVAPNPNPQSKVYENAFRGVLELVATVGDLSGEAKLIRAHHEDYPSVKTGKPTPADANLSGTYDNTAVIKHMAVVNDELTVYGWSNLEHNYIYLDVDASDYDNLTFKTEVAKGASSTPDSVKVQYSLNKENWYDVPNSTTALAGVDVWSSITVFLPESTYNQSQVYVRVVGSSGSTSGWLKFKNLSFRSTPNAKPEREGEKVFSHINLNPGKNPSEIGFSWFTAAGSANTPVIEYQKATDLEKDKYGDYIMTSGATSVAADKADGSSVYDTNKITLTGLEASTVYAYRVGNGTEWSYTYSFATQNPEKFKFLVVADPQVSGSDANWNASAARMYEKHSDAAFVLNCGDHVNESNHLVQIQGYVGPNALRSFPVASAYGNHDHDFHKDYPEQIRYLPLLYNWPNATNVKSGAQFDGHDWYYSYGDVLYIFLDSNVKDIETHRPIMQEAKDSHPDAKWTIATFHHDIYGGGAHAGTGYGDAKIMQSVWSPFMDDFDVDIAFNGHDHIYTRSKLMENDTYQRFQMTGKSFDQDLRTQNPGAVIRPKGVQYMALATPGSKFYPLEPQPWHAYAEERSDRPEFTVVEYDGNTMNMVTYQIIGDKERIIDSIAIRKQALKEDLINAVNGAKEVQKGSIIAGWEHFQDMILAAEGMLATDVEHMPAQIDEAFVNLYEAYFALEVNQNFFERRALSLLIPEVKTFLLNAVEGRWTGQYPVGSKDTLQAVLDAAIVVDENFIATDAECVAAHTDLTVAFNAFKGSVSDTEPPWATLHKIEATGGIVDLIGFMDESMTVEFSDEIDRYDSNHAKYLFASGKLPQGAFEPGNEGVYRTNPRYGPDNSEGGRGTGNGHIRNPSIGSWIRYEVDVAEAGMYKVELGAINPTASAQQVLIRDTVQNVLSTFTVPANHEKEKEWANANLVAGDKNIYLPAGRSTIELFFRNDGAVVSNRYGYKPGPSVDILKLTPTTGERPNFEPNPLRYELPLHPFAPNSADVNARQRGWATPSYVDAKHNPGTVPVEIFKNATHLNLELATNATFNTGVDLVIVADGTTWSSFSINRDMHSAWYNATTRVVSIPLTPEGIGQDSYNHLKTTVERAGILLCYYGTSWNELNISRAWFTLPTAFDFSCKDGHTKKGDNCSLCSVCNMQLARTCETPCVAHDTTHKCNPKNGGHIYSMEDCNVCANGCGVALGKACIYPELCKIHATNELLLKKDEDRNVAITYNPEAAEEWAVWGAGNSFQFNLLTDVHDGKEYELKFDIGAINDLEVSKKLVASDFSVLFYGMAGASDNYKWTALAGENYTVKEKGNIYKITLSSEALGFDISHLTEFGVQIAINDEHKNDGSFEPGDKVIVPITYELWLKLDGDPPPECGDCGLKCCDYCQGTVLCTDYIGCITCHPGVRCTTCNGNIDKRGAKGSVKVAPTEANRQQGECTCYILGDLNNNANIEVGDAVQILMHLAKNPTSQVATDPRAKKASLITNPNLANPVVADAVQVLMNLAKNPTSIVDKTIVGNR